MAEKFPLQVVSETATDFLVAELMARLKNGDFLRNCLFYAPVARLILSEESLLYPELIEPPEKDEMDA